MDTTRYREAEGALWASVGLRPAEQHIRLAGTGTQVRVQTTGEGPPALFLHGVPNAGATWAPVLAGLSGLQAIVVDRPGAGLSEPLPQPLDATTLSGFADRFATDVLDGLGISRAHLVASSFGSYLALRAAAVEPQRFDRLVLLGAPAFVAGAATPGLLRMLATPMHRLLPKFPPSDKNTLRSIRQLGHAATVDAGRLPAPLLTWFSSLQAHTETFLHDGRMVSRLVSPWRGTDRTLTLGADVLDRVKLPTLIVWGDHDPFGDAEVARRFADMLERAELHTMPNAGHLPWLDDPGMAADLIKTHLKGAGDRYDQAGA